MKKKFTKTDLVIGTLLTLFAIAILYPFYNSILVSLVPQDVYVKTPFMLFPKKITLSAYQFVFSSKSIMNGFLVTLFVTVAGVIYNMFLTVTTAYALTKDIPGKKLIMHLIIFTVYFGGGLIPYYLLIKNIGLMNNLWVMVLPIGFWPMYMIIVKTFFEELPVELEESAKVDGANDLVILFKIILPLSLPVLATFALYYGVERWNEWWHGMLFIQTASKQPLQLVLRNIVQSAGEMTQNLPAGQEKKVFADGVKMASIIVTMFPVMCLFPFLQRYFVEGLTIGAVKS